MVMKVGIALLGLGTVGATVLEILRENETYFEKEFGVHICVYFVYVRDVHKKRTVSLDKITVTDDVEMIMNSPQVDVCIECMGGSGTEETFDIIMRMIEKRKHVIMSSKKCLALYKSEIIEKVNQYHVQLRYDATVGGSIPICKVFQNLSGYDPIHRMYGIANATTNYVLTLMQDKGMDYRTALEMAQKEGYAENNASDDVDGWDALYKMCILLRFGAGIDVVTDQIIPKGLEAIADIGLETVTDSPSEKPEHKIKQIFYVEQLTDDKIGYYVGPITVKTDTVLGNVEGQNNIIFVKNKYGGLRAYYGKGAGGKETAAIMVEDLLDAIFNDIPVKAAKKCVHIEQMRLKELRL